MLKKGDIVYAEKIRNKEGKAVDKSENNFPDTDDYITSLHSAICTGEKDKEVWHATAVEGSSCSWSLGKFTHYYRPVAAKRIA